MEVSTKPSRCAASSKASVLSGQQISDPIPIHVLKRGEEFVTAGGVDLGEVNLATMESRRCAGLYLAGELLDVDGVTGGFNFQACWSGGWLAGEALATSLLTQSDHKC